MEGTIGEIRLFAGNFPPKNWAFCQGQIIAIRSNTALFSILGTTYGGDGQTTFALPDLQGRVPVGAGQGPGLSNYVLGQVGGVESTTLTQANLPAHIHNLAGTVKVADGADNTSPAGTYPGAPTNFDMYAENPGSGTMLPNLLMGQAAPVGGASPVPIMQPYEGMYYVICMYGVFPYRG